MSKPTNELKKDIEEFKQCIESSSPLIVEVFFMTLDKTRGVVTAECAGKRFSVIVEKSDLQPDQHPFSIALSELKYRLVSFKTIPGLGVAQFKYRKT